MAVIGIITCEILEREFAWLLGTDPEVERISVLENRCSTRLIDLLDAQSVSHLHRLPHSRAFRAEPDDAVEVIIRVLEMGLHRNRNLLRKSLMAAADELRPHAATLLLGYGLCGNALENPAALLDMNIPIFLPMDQGHPVDDCVGLCLGGRACYLAELRKTPGTFFITPGWSNHWKQMLDANAGALAVPGLKRMLSRYKRALVIKTPAMEDQELLRNGREFSQQSGLLLEIYQGTMAPLLQAWRETKRSIMSQSTSSSGEERSP
jgi:hypothetical protein